MNSPKKNDLMILENIGLKAYSLEEGRDILEIAESRYGKGAMVLSEQIEHGKWYELFPGPTTVDVIMYRMVHNLYVLVLESKKFMSEAWLKRDL